MLPFLFVLQIILAAGLAFPMAIFSVWYRDVQHALPVLVMALFYSSPIFYPLSIVPERYEILVSTQPDCPIVTPFPCNPL